MKTAIRIIRDHVGCISYNLDEKDVEVYVISKLPKEKLQEKIEQYKKKYLVEEDFKFIDNLPADIVENVNVCPEDNIIKLPGLHVYNTKTKKLNILEEDLFNE